MNMFLIYRFEYGEVFLLSLSSIQSFGKTSSFRHTSAHWTLRNYHCGFHLMRLGADNISAWYTEKKEKPHTPCNTQTHTNTTNHVARCCKFCSTFTDTRKLAQQPLDTFHSAALANCRPPTSPSATWRESNPWVQYGTIVYSISPKFETLEGKLKGWTRLACVWLGFELWWYIAVVCGRATLTLEPCQTFVAINESSNLKL